MDMDRGALARIDRKVLAGLDHDERWQMVRVPASEAVWSTWKRYCDARGISMGRGIAALMECELRSVVGDEVNELLSWTELKDRLDARQVELEAREQSVAERERWIRQVERRLTAITPPARRPDGTAKVGRNAPCPCGSGLKHKRCHGG